MANIAKEFSEDEISSQLVSQISWFALVKIFYKSNFKFEKLFSQTGGKKYMSRLARVFKIDEISHQPGDRIPWWTIVQIIFKI